MLPSEFRCIMSNYNNVFQSNSNTLLGQLICDKTTPMQRLHKHSTSTMYMYINFQQNQASRSVKNVHTNLFANNHDLH